jgi:hypothetical protein
VLALSDRAGPPRSLGDVTTMNADHLEMFIADAVGELDLDTLGLLPLPVTRRGRLDHPSARHASEQPALS